jgi:hypothetical protein
VSFIFSTECADDFISGEVFWLMGQFLSDPREVAEAILWMVNDLYYVIEGEQESTIEKQIGEVTFKGEFIKEAQPFFAFTAVMNQP